MYFPFFHPLNSQCDTSKSYTLSILNLDIKPIPILTYPILPCLYLNPCLYPYLYLPGW